MEYYPEGSLALSLIQLEKSNVSDRQQKVPLSIKERSPTEVTPRTIMIRTFSWRVGRMFL